MSVLNIRRVPDDLHHAAKVKAAKEQVTLRAVVLRLLAEWVRGTKATRDGGTGR